MAKTRNPPKLLSCVKSQTKTIITEFQLLNANMNKAIGDPNT